MHDWAVPEQREGDSDEVRQALARAEQAWGRQAHAETMGWLRRAAGLAAQRQDDARAIQLFIAAAEVADAMARSERAPAAPPRTGPRRRPWEQAAAQEEADSVKKTAETPRTRLRRAIMAIDPDYAQRVDLDPSHPLGGPLGQALQTATSTAPAIAFLGEREADDTWSSDDDAAWNDGGRRSVADRAASAAPRSAGAAPSRAPAAPGALPVFRVSLVPIPEDNDIRLLFVSSDAPGPRGLPSALLVPENEDDAALLWAIYDECDAKV